MTSSGTGTAVPAPVGGALRVGVIGPIGGDSFAENILECLPGVGADPVALGPAFPQPASRPVAATLELLRRASDHAGLAYQRRLVAAAERAGINVVVSVDLNLLPATVRELRRRGVRVCMWFPDAVANLDRQRMLLGDYDALFFKDPLLARRLSDLLDLPAHYLPEACNPVRHRPPATAPELPYVVFVGNMYSARARLIGQLLDHGVDVRIYGPAITRWLRDPWLVRQHAGRYVAGEEKAAVFRGAHAVVNALHPAEMQSVNCRLFEATACGGTVLCERREALPGLFDEDREVLAFSTFGELLDRIKWCADDRVAARAVGDAASRRSHVDHTYQHRLTELLEVVL
ncbi:CgeB family protein [Pseudofrankia asymbiotica]|uniref:CgeB family protein n=1 Tax=Pseudofrankia asymbiotica TaxID=1834516 RepID=UPI0009D6AD71|nr:glycosyltransferase [Pseudofrankia asymbiotica]